MTSFAPSAAGTVALTLPAALQAAAQQYPFAEGIVDGSLRMTLAELQNAATEFAAALIASGLKPGERVALWAPNSVRWVVAAFGVLRAGGVLVTVNTRFKGDEAVYVLNRSKARFLVVETGFLGLDFLEMLRAVGPLETTIPDLVSTIDAGAVGAANAVGWTEFLARGDAQDGAACERRVAEISPDDVSDIMFTAGTTGLPKGAMCTHAQNVMVNRAWAQTVGLRPSDRYLAVNPFFHSFGYRAGVLAAALTGATLYPMRTFDLDAALDIVERERITVLPGPPTIYLSLLDHPQRVQRDLSSVRLAVTGAAVVPVAMLERMHAELGFETILTAYGLTETCGTATICPPGTPVETIAATVGKPLAGTEVKVVDAEGTEVPAGSSGEVVVRGYNVMRGYLDDPSATAAAIDPDGWLHTGDIGQVDDQGFLRITDRIKDMYLVGGFNAYPAEIEQIIMKHPDVLEVAVVGVPDPRLGEVGRAFVVARSGHHVNPEEIIEFCKSRMANYKVPRSVRVLESLPRNPGGKVTKDVLRDFTAQH